MIRVGNGFDAHRLVKGRQLILGGVEIPYPMGLEGHSDADVLTHAIIDALLGAAALGDIGDMFPDTDSKYKDADSLSMLEKVTIRLGQSGYKLINLDSTIMAQEPKLSPHFGNMISALAKALAVEESQISVKATTTEGLGFIGRQEGISALAVVLVESF
jgi:2-C-methyl-D-erythritol 2,4-cyclodiphosphate synthase